MVLSLGALAVVTAGLVVGVWAVCYGVLSALEVDGAATLASGIALAALVAVGALEYRQVGTIERRADAHPVDPDTAPRVHRIATRVAALLDVPVPTIAVSERDAPEAMVAGFRPDGMHLVVSLGTLRALDDDELEAVIAHELAHVANRDAMVMTAVSLPVVLADGIRLRLDSGDVVSVVLLVVATVGWVVGRTITAGLARAREAAADRAAAEATGSPAALARALATLDERIDGTPNRDLRAAAGVSALSILPLDPDEPEKVMLGPEGDVEPSYWWARARLYRLERLLFGTHPPTDRRIEALSERARTRT